MKEAKKERTNQPDQPKLLMMPKGVFLFLVQKFQQMVTWNMLLFKPKDKYCKAGSATNSQNT